MLLSSSVVLINHHNNMLSLNTDSACQQNLVLPYTYQERMSHGGSYAPAHIYTGFYSGFSLMQGGDKPVCA